VTIPVARVVVLLLVGLLWLTVPPTIAQTDQALDEATRLLGARPDGVRRATLIVHRGQEGHWTLRNAAGETISAASPDEFKSALANVGRDASMVLFTAPTLFRLDAAGLPKSDLGKASVRLEGIYDGAIHSVVRNRSGAFHLMKRPRLGIALGDKADVDAAWAALDRRWSLAPRALRIEPNGPKTLAASARVPAAAPSTDGKTTALRKPLIDAIDPTALTDALRSVPRQTLVLAGRRDGERLLTESGGGRRPVTLDLLTLRRSVIDHDVSLVIVDQGNALQPETPSWLIRSTEISGWKRFLDRHAAAGTVADFLEALLDPADRPRAPVAVRVARLETDQPVDLVAAPLDVAASEPITRTVTRSLGDLGRRLAGSPPAETVRLLLPPTARQIELDRRVVGALPSWLTFGLGGLFLLGLLGSSVSWRWWGRLWPLEQASDYASGTGYRLAKAMRALLYAVVFMPLSALAAAPMRILQAFRRA
jgi:hypothetical protein